MSRTHFLDQEEPLQGLRERCFAIAKAVRERDTTLPSEDDLEELAETIYDLVSMKVPVPAPPMFELAIACYVPLSAALERNTGRHGDVDIPVAPETLPKLSPAVREMLLAAEDGGGGVRRVPGTFALEVPSDSQEDLIEALKKHAERVAPLLVEASALCGVGPSTATDAQLERAARITQHLTDGRLSLWRNTALVLRRIVPVLAGDPSDPGANKLSTKDLMDAFTEKPVWVEKIQRWNAAVDEAARARAKAEAEAKRAADAVLVQTWGTDSQKARLAAGVLPRAEIEKLRKAALDIELDAALPRMRAHDLGLVAYQKITTDELTEAHHPKAAMHVVRYGIFTCEQVTDATDVQWITMDLVREAHPGAVVTLLRHVGRCDLMHARGEDLDACNVEIVRYGVRAEINGLKREYGVLETK